MRNSLLNYGGIITKVRAMGSHLMKREDYTQIASLETPQEFVNFLKSTPDFEELFEEYDESKLHRAQIEQILTNSIHLSYAKLYRFANQEQRRALYFIFFRFEVNVLKVCLQRLFNEEESYDLLLFDSFFERHSKLAVNELATARTIEEFISHLQNTEYYPLFQKLYNTHHDSLQDYEVQLDIYYFTKSWKLIDRILTGQNKKAITAIMGTQIDLLNMQWIYRSKKFYDIDTGKILASIIPVQYKVSKETLIKMIECVSIEELLRLMKATYYHKVYQIVDTPSIEVASQKTLTKMYSSFASKYSASMAPVICYLYEKEVELDKLTTALECIRYRLEPDEILNYLLQ